MVSWARTESGREKVPERGPLGIGILAVVAGLVVEAFPLQKLVELFSGGHGEEEECT